MGKSKVARRKAAHSRKTAQEEHHNGEAVQSVDTKTASQNGRPAAAVTNGDTVPRNEKTELVSGWVVLGQCLSVLGRIADTAH